jgi:hypothetical protein
MVKEAEAQQFGNLVTVKLLPTASHIDACQHCAQVWRLIAKRVRDVCEAVHVPKE